MSPQLEEFLGFLGEVWSLVVLLVEFGSAGWSLHLWVEFGYIRWSLYLLKEFG